MPDNRLVLPYRDDEGNIHVEKVRTTKDNDYYRIETIPLYASRIALFDIVEAQRRGGVLYFHAMIESSGRSVIQMTILKEGLIKAVMNDIKRFGCMWRLSDDKHLIAFDVPGYMLYQPIKDWLDQGEKEQLWGYREACMSHK